jgi:hypothetical protein
LVGLADEFDLDLEDENDLEEENEDEDDATIEVDFVDVEEKTEKKRRPGLFRPSKWYRALFSK